MFQIKSLSSSSSPAPSHSVSQPQCLTATVHFQSQFKELFHRKFPPLPVLPRSLLLFHINVKWLLQGQSSLLTVGSSSLSLNTWLKWSHGEERKRRENSMQAWHIGLSTHFLWAAGFASLNSRKSVPEPFSENGSVFGISKTTCSSAESNV